MLCAVFICYQLAGPVVAAYSAVYSLIVLMAVGNVQHSIAVMKARRKWLGQYYGAWFAAIEREKAKR